MSTTQLQLRRDTHANIALATPAAGEPGFDTTNTRLIMGDGSRAGGWEHANVNDIRLQGFITPSISGTNSLTATNTIPILALTTGLRQIVVPVNDISGAVTYTPDGLTTKDVKKWKAGVLSAMESGDWKAGGRYPIDYDGTRWIWCAPDLGNVAAPGLVLLATASGGGASYDFTGFITSTYKNYKLVLEDIIPSTNGADLRLRVRRSGQGSYDATGYSYAFQANSGTVSQSSSSSANQILLRGPMASAALGGAGFSGEVWCFGLPNATRGKFSWRGVEGQSAGGVTDVDGSGMRNTSAALDSLQLLMSSGNINGAAYLYGLKAS